jgi:hypothetical protein
MSLIALAHSTGLDMAAFSQIAGAIFNTLALLLVWYIPIRYFSAKGFAAFLAPLLYILFFPFHYFAASGLETSLYTALILLCLYTVLWAEFRCLPFVGAGFVFLLTALTRPEGIIFFVFYCGYLLWRSVFKKESLKPYVPGIFLFVAGYGVFMAWRLSYYGLPFPNTYYAKVTLPFIFQTLFGLLMTKGFVTHYPHFLLFLLAYVGLAKLAAEKSLIPVVVLLSAGLFFSIGFSAWDWMPFFRYTIPVVPLLIIVCQIMFSRVWQTLSSDGHGKKKLIWGCITALFVFVAAEQFVSDLAFNLRINKLDDCAFHNQKLFGEWLKKEVGRKPVIAVGDVGRLAFFSEANILDIFGLTNREFAKTKQDYGTPQINFPSPGISFDRYKEKERQLLLKLAPDYIFLYNARIKISETYFGSAAGIVDQADFQKKYEYMTTLILAPGFFSDFWPKLLHPIDINDLATGLQFWVRDRWGYDIYIRRDSPYKRFTFESAPDERIKRIRMLPAPQGILLKDHGKTP